MCMKISKRIQTTIVVVVAIVCSARKGFKKPNNNNKHGWLAAQKMGLSTPLGILRK